MDGALEKQPCVYLLANKRSGVLYTGATSNLLKRVWEHKHRVTGQFNAYSLVWFETHETMENAIQRKQTINKWHRVWKIRTIEDHNPHWRDLYQDLV